MRTPGRRGLLLGLGAWGLAGRAAAMYAPLTDDELLQGSALIALGDWLGQTRLVPAPQAAPLELGVLALREVLKGPAQARIALVHTESPEAPRHSASLRYRVGDSGLWLLRLPPGAEGLYRADHPLRFVPAATGQARIALLRQRLKALHLP